MCLPVMSQDKQSSKHCMMGHIEKASVCVCVCVFLCKKASMRAGKCVLSVAGSVGE